MSSPPLRDSVDFMMAARRGFDHNAALQSLRERTLAQAEANINTLAATLRAQTQAGQAHVNVQLDSVCELNPFANSNSALEHARVAANLNRAVMRDQNAALDETDATIAATRATNKKLETALNNHLAELKKKTLSADAERLCQAGAEQCKNLATGERR